MRRDVLHLRHATDVVRPLLRGHVPAARGASPSVKRLTPRDDAVDGLHVVQRAAARVGLCTCLLPSAPCGLLKTLRPGHCSRSCRIPAAKMQPPHPMIRGSRKVDTRAPRLLDHSTLHATTSPARIHNSSCVQHSPPIADQQHLLGTRGLHICSMQVAVADKA